MRAEMARGAAWMVLFRLFDRSVGVVSTAMLARLLVPGDFGLVAMAMSIIAIIELATAFSFEIALIQKADPRHEHYDTAWTLNILLATGGATITAALAPAAASFYNEPRLTLVMLCIAGAWLVQGFENIGTVNFRREMDFSSEFRFMATKRVVTFFVTIAAAFTLRSYWALVIGMTTGRLLGVALSYWMQPFRPRLSLACARELFSFSGWMLANNMAQVILGRLPHFVVGRVYGAQTLGAYTVGSEIAQLAHTELVAPINRAMFPGFARLVNDPETFRRICIEATAAILIVVLPVSFAIAVFAEPMVRVLLGAQWSEAAPVIRILAFSGAISALTSNNIAAYLALGQPRLVTLIFGSRLVLFLGAVAVLIQLEPRVTGVAHAELLAAVVSLVVSLPILFRSLHITFTEYIASAWRPLLASLAASAAVYFGIVRHAGEETFLAAITQLLLGLPLGLVLYTGALWLLWRASGRPASVEAMIGRRALDTLAARLGRRREPAT